MTSNRHISWIVAEKFFILSVLVAVLFAILSDEIAQTLKLDQSQLGLLSGVFFITYAVGQLGFGIALSLISPRFILAGTAALSAVGTILFAVSDSFGAAIMARALMGIGLSSTFVGVIYLVGANYSGNFAFMSSLSQSLANLSAAAIAILSALIPFLVDFRMPFLIMGILFLINAVLLFLFLGKSSAGNSASSPKANLGAALKTSVTNPQFWAALVYYSGLFGSLLAFADLWNIQFQMNFFKHSIETSSVMNAMIPVGVTIGGLLAGAWAERSGFVLPARCFGILTVLFFIVMLFIPLPEFAAGAMMFLMGFGFSGSILGLTPIQKNLPATAVPLATSLVVTSAFIFGGVIQPLIGGAIGAPHRASILINLLQGDTPDFGAYQRGILWLLFSVVIATAASFFFKEKTNKDSF
ncbi:MFS transporter [Candidatus Methylospira mobilis]|uniref:MFS transporter n=1 Tax=Candidatus Methylospira mobilis TaxID=1808979 RepID=UPI0028E951CA|nr:MFS transporter [Candidatus Methylospira mobilis]WNV04693.1 MFS transporter [Candidatus Methylospira mobilis]